MVERSTDGEHAHAERLDTYNRRRYEKRDAQHHLAAPTLPRENSDNAKRLDMLSSLRRYELPPQHLTYNLFGPRGPLTYLIPTPVAFVFSRLHPSHAPYLTLALRMTSDYCFFAARRFCKERDTSSRARGPWPGVRLSSGTEAAAAYPRAVEFKRPPKLGLRQDDPTG